ncbi:tetratricopeptide repeat protein [Motilimonas pumila]|uniref:Uncharacterized protein n=1 Tax=Motilimonas pumila TaxID=2303987 RepID=A0A418YEF9_9GAMM|nr:tetratricopeptide repeat protein [Motilimonas pumila]RJG47507.1 hypothetical protein D1Z90_11395 [Motilimonas pumila]
MKIWSLWLLVLSILAAPLQAKQLTQSEHSTISRAIKQIQAEQYGAAKTQLVELEAKLKPQENKDYALAMVWLNLANIALRQDRYQAGLKYYDQAVATGTLTPEQTLPLLLTRAQLNMSLENWAQGTQLLRQWLQQAPAAQVKAQHYQLLAQGYVQQEKWQGATKAINQALKRKPNAATSWYQIAVVAHSKLKQWNSAIKWQKRILAREPKAMLQWQQLAGLQMRANKSKDALATFRLAHQQGLFNRSQQYRILAQLLLQQGNAYQAAQVINKAMVSGKIKDTQKHQKLLSQAWLQAKQQDQAMQTLAKLAKQDPNKQNLWQLGQLQLQQQRWQDALVTLKQLTGGSDSDRVYLMMAIANINLKQYPNARAMLAKIDQESTYHGEVLSWRNYLAHIAPEPTLEDTALPAKPSAAELQTAATS